MDHKVAPRWLFYLRLFEHNVSETSQRVFMAKDGKGRWDREDIIFRLLENLEVEAVYLTKMHWHS